MNINNPQDNLAHQVVDLKARVGHLETLINTNAGLWIPLDFQQVSGVASTLSFTSIPQIYERLRIIYYLQSVRVAVSDTLRIRFNADSTLGNYGYNWIRLNATIGFAANSTDIQVGELSASNTNVFSSGDFGIFDYTSLVNDKIIHGMQGGYSYFTGVRFGGIWNPVAVAAITQIDLSSVTGTNLSIGSWAQLYGFIQPS